MWTSTLSHGPTKKIQMYRNESKGSQSHGWRMIAQGRPSLFDHAEHQACRMGTTRHAAHLCPQNDRWPSRRCWLSCTCCRALLTVRPAETLGNPQSYMGSTLPSAHRSITRINLEIQRHGFISMRCPWTGQEDATTWWHPRKMCQRHGTPLESMWVLKQSCNESKSLVPIWNMVRFDRNSLDSWTTNGRPSRALDGLFSWPSKEKFSKNLQKNPKDGKIKKYSKKYRKNPKNHKN